MRILRALLLGFWLGSLPCALAVETARPRVIVSTDAGGTDFDDFQSLVHLLLYADVLDIEGILSSPYGGNHKDHILRVIDLYERDYPNLRTYSPHYPTAAALRAITKQGETETAPYAGFRRPTEGSQWIIECARRDDPRPLHLQIWGGIEDLAQALHDAPDILPKLRVYYIGGPNKKWSPDAYHYIATNHPTLWMIECNDSYQGFFTGGDQSGDLGNETFIPAHAAGRGAMGDYLAKGISFRGERRTAIRMGDSPAIGWLLQGDPSDPAKPGWGGQFVRAWPRPYKAFHRLTTADDEIEQFSIFELVLQRGPLPPSLPSHAPPLDGAVSHLLIENQSLLGTTDGSGVTRFRFSPKEAKQYSYKIESNIRDLDALTGTLTSVQPAPDSGTRPDPTLPNWWTDDPAPAQAEGNRIGAKTVNRWRADVLRDFAARLERCRVPAGSR